MGSTRHQAQHYINIEGLLPNSQLVVIPYQPSGQTTPSSWSRELYLHPGDWIPWVAASLAAATLVLAVIVAVLHINEKVLNFPSHLISLLDTDKFMCFIFCTQREDERERRRKAHTIKYVTFTY